MLNNNRVLNESVGEVGCQYISSTSARTGNWFAVQVLTDAKFSVLTDARRVESEGSVKLDSGTSGECITVPAGVILWGSFTAITLHSGAVIAYVKA